MFSASSSHPVADFSLCPYQQLASHIATWNPHSYAKHRVESNQQPKHTKDSTCVEYHLIGQNFILKRRKKGELGLKGEQDQYLILEKMKKMEIRIERGSKVNIESWKKEEKRELELRGEAK